MIFETTDILISAHSHVHSTGGESVWQQAFELITEPAHAITEVFYSLLFDALLIPITILIYKRIREPKLRQEIHEEIDKEHGVNHLECNDKEIDESPNLKTVNRPAETLRMKKKTQKQNKKIE